jgi:hypothetical protein
MKPEFDKAWNAAIIKAENAIKDAPVFRREGVFGQRDAETLMVLDICIQEVRKLRRR